VTKLSEAPPEPGVTPPAPGGSALSPPGLPGLGPAGPGPGQPRTPPAPAGAAAAGPATLTASYERCRQLNRQHGTSYYLATRLLPDWKRPHVHALYGFARYADEIVDDLGNGLSPAQRALALADWGERFFDYLKGDRCDEPVLAAVVHTVRSFGIDQADFRAFLASMAMDLTVTCYTTYDDLLGYMDGSAAVIGTMMLPVLEPADPDRAREPARQLGLAFQLTNFIRDVGEDLRRGRIYLPLADLDRFGVAPADLARPEPTPAVRELLAFECARARAHYQAALPGVELLAPSSRPCIRAALELYGGILDELERRDYQVLRGRVRLSRRRKAAIFVRHLTAAARAARRERQVDVSLPGS
jgi:15-cis-phytoene synthase